MKGKSLIGVILAAICVTVTYLLPGSEELSHEGITALGVLGMASILWISNTLPFGVTGLLALVMLVLLGVSDMASVFVGFSNSSVIFVITVFCLTAAVMNTKLTLRLINKLLRWAGSSAEKLVLAYMAAAALLSSVMSNVPVTVLFLGLAQPVLKAVGAKPGSSRLGKCLMIGIPFAAVNGGMATPAGSSFNVLAMGVFESIAGKPLTFLQWMAVGLPTAIVATLVCWICLVKISGERKIIVIDDVDEDNAAYSGCLAYPNEEISSADRSGEGCLMQIYTSGTTSIPKGVMLSDNAICSHALGHLTDICQTGNSVYMCVLPLFHASSSGAIATLIAGATVVVLERFRPKVYLKMIEKYKATALSLTPSMFSALLDEIDEGSYDLTSVKSVIYGAEPILAKYIRKANEKLGCDFYQLFGMSEMGPVITLLRAEDHRAKDDALLEKRLKSVGKVALGAKIKIVAPDGSKCPVGRQGEIYAQGLGQMMCYYNAPDKTASVFSDGWYHTGDVGYLDEDNYLYLVGRMSDMIISGGENVYPKSVEECILALDGVENVAVVGLKDDHLGEAVTAVIVKAPGTELDEATVRNWCKGKIAGFMKPRKVFFVNELPVNSTGKIDKRKLTEMFN